MNVQAPTPLQAPTSNATAGTIRIVTRNIRGLADNLPALLRCRSDVYLIQEVDFIEYQVNEFKALAMQAGYQLIFGEPTQLGADASAAHGRRTAIAVKTEYNIDTICSSTEEHIKTLSASGRWVERLIHFSNDCQVLVASYYCIPGASVKGAKHTDNERLLQLALTPIAVNGKVPYIFGTDLNDNPAHSETVVKAAETEIIDDVVAAAFGNAPPPTYCKGGIQEGMAGTGCTRIDTLLCRRDTPYRKSNTYITTRTDSTTHLL